MTGGRGVDGDVVRCRDGLLYEVVSEHHGENVTHGSIEDRRVESPRGDRRRHGTRIVGLDEIDTGLQRRDFLTGGDRLKVGPNESGEPEVLSRTRQQGRVSTGGDTVRLPVRAHEGCRSRPGRGFEGTKIDLVEGTITHTHVDVVTVGLLNVHSEVLRFHGHTRRTQTLHQ